VLTTLRIALLTGLLALVSTTAVIAFIYWRTADVAVTEMHRQVEEQGAVLAEVYRSGGRSALIRAITDTADTGDPQTAAALLDPAGRPVSGNVEQPPRGPLREGSRVALIRLQDESSPREAAIVLHRLNGSDGWLLNARTATYEGLELRETLERSLLLGLMLAVLMGVGGGALMARFVENRLRRIVVVANRISDGDVTQRVPLSGANDAFDGLGREINRMLDRLATLMSELRVLTDTLAHDLRSPVGRMRAAADAAMVATSADDRDAQLAAVCRHADGLTRMLTTVMEIGRSESLTTRNQFTVFAPADLIGELAEMYEPVVEETGRDLEVKAQRDLPQMVGHRQLLAQAMSNLIENALRHADSGEIVVGAEVDGDIVRLGVADRGKGIALAQQAEARRRFGRLDSSRSRDGAGLGLALVEAIAHLHGGQLVLEDNGPGLRAWIEVPRREVPVIVPETRRPLESRRDGPMLADRRGEAKDEQHDRGRSH
jgi:signal transduction histidine kinase